MSKKRRKSTGRLPPAAPAIETVGLPPMAPAQGVYCWAHTTGRLRGKDGKDGQDGQDGPTRVLAECFWTFKMSGNTVALCASCAQAFWLGALVEPDLAPRRIRVIRPAS